VTESFDEPGTLVRVHESLGLAEAEELERALDLAGIPCFLNNENMAALFPGAFGGVSGLGLGHVVIMVPSDFANAAREIIARTLSDLEETDSE
jgi:hypothetical protein